VEGETPPLRERARRIASRTLIALIVLAALLGGTVYWLWNDRPALDAVPIPPTPGRVPPVDAVTATWFGTSTLLFDDGETQILIDGYVSRPPLTAQLFNRPVSSDAAAINRFMLDNRLDRLAAIIPAHTHMDHAFDIGALANRSRASIIGSPSALLIGRGEGVPDDQLVAVGSRAEFTFGEFTVTLIPVPHAAFGWNGTVPLDGVINRPLAQPARPGDYRVGLSFAVVVAHPQGTAVVQASAGFAAGALDGIPADAVFLGVGMLESLGREYAEQYWQNVVTATGATRVLPVHFDDYTRPFGETRLLPPVIDDFVETAGWLRDIRATWDRDTTLELPVFGEPITLYVQDESTGT
jgi:L-ascorbate metabolism protein UlaG (beta-lactamase superfamily)